ncbi:MAG: GreA/GreB family elongation factor [Polyangiaceae bacterium]|nr:GreA/GreB family elongation factor [Polyangiaceae bacterium]
MPAAKRALVKKLGEQLSEEIEALKRSAYAAREAATHEEARPENDKDTRAVEAAYLAGAQADRVRDLERVANALEFLTLRAFGPEDPIALSALIEADVDGELHRFFLAPQGGGMKVELDRAVIVVVTPESPVGRALIGKRTGDIVEVRTQRGLREYEIVSVA